ncbi:DNA primase [Streptomyces sp.]|uniref:DNA primase n=1 Tax=Streptomyces sp. TaxID=1931 RepID=UPI0028127214|nr:DNA primase [Streptomyces sp.]
MNRMGLGLAIGAGYLLGRTKKLKMAVAVGGLVAGKKLNLSPRMVAELLQEQLRNNPQFKEIGDQLREDLRGVGKAASGAMVERQLDALADRLHGRTAQVRDQLSGAVPGRSKDDEADEAEDAEYADDEDEEPEGEEPEDSGSEEDDEPEDSGSEEDEEPEAEKSSASKAPARKAAKRASTSKAPAKKAAARKTSAAKKTATGNRGGGSRSRQPKGGGEE